MNKHYISGNELSLKNALEQALKVNLIGYNEFKGEYVYRAVFGDGSIYYPYLTKNLIEKYNPNLLK